MEQNQSFRVLLLDNDLRLVEARKAPTITRVSLCGSQFLLVLGDTEVGIQTSGML